MERDAVLSNQTFGIGNARLADVQSRLCKLFVAGKCFWVADAGAAGISIHGAVVAFGSALDTSAIFAVVFSFDVRAVVIDRAARAFVGVEVADGSVRV